MKTKRAAFVAVVASALALAAAAQSRLPPGVDGGRGQATATRSVARYLDLERSLAQALGERRRDDALRLLAPDFEARTASSLDAVAAPEWLAGEMRAGGVALVRDLAVRETGDVAIVSFFLDRPRPRAATLYVIDVWRRADERLEARYASQPSQPLRAPQRPRGRE